jgi:hypothetical protein
VKNDSVSSEILVFELRHYTLFEPKPNGPEIIISLLVSLSKVVLHRTLIQRVGGSQVEHTFYECLCQLSGQ